MVPGEGEPLSAAMEMSYKLAKVKQHKNSLDFLRYRKPIRIRIICDDQGHLSLIGGLHSKI